MKVKSTLLKAIWMGVTCYFFMPMSNIDNQCLFKIKKTEGTQSKPAQISYTSLVLASLCYVVWNKSVRWRFLKILCFDQLWPLESACFTGSLAGLPKLWEFQSLGSSSFKSVNIYLWFLMKNIRNQVHQKAVHVTKRNTVINSIDFRVSYI